MDHDEERFKCSCGRSYSTPGPLTVHRRTCSGSQKRLAAVLQGSKDIFLRRKKHRGEALATGVMVEPAQNMHSQSMDALRSLPATSAPLQCAQTPVGSHMQDQLWEDLGPEVGGVFRSPYLLYDANNQLQVINPPVELNTEPDDESSLAQRRSRRRIHLPIRLTDFMPSALVELPPAGHDNRTSPPPSPIHAPLARRIINTSRNLFGLFRQYTKRLPNHDPEEHVDLAGLTDTAAEHVPTEDIADIANSKRSFYPFPNKSSFQLSEWYWTDGAQKSQTSFKKMVGIVSSPDFKPEDVKDTKWDKMNDILGANDFDKSGPACDSSPLADGAQDAGWRKKAITITVPFHRRSKSPGPKDFLVGDFYYRSLVEVLREKLANAEDDHQFHYQPYELRWQPTSVTADAPSERVYGELYTSPAFLEANNALQDAPGELGCTLERVVAGMMFSSDATQLTTFGTAKLWPCYLYFGNESKYRRCKPQCKLCHHVAYFQAVCFKMHIGPPVILIHCPSFPTTSRTSQPNILELAALPRTSPRIVVENYTTRNGKSCSMMSFWKHTNMALSLTAATASSGDFTRVYSHIQRTTQKSELCDIFPFLDCL